MNEIAADFASPRATAQFWAGTVRWTGAALVAMVWLSAIVFGAYILSFYGGAWLGGAAEHWNHRAEPPRLFDRSAPMANIGIGLHFLAGSILLFLGPVQLIGAVRRRVPKLHRWTGRLYASSAVLAGLGGLVYILLKGTIGGMPMNIAFALYGALLALAAFHTARHARARRFEAHRAWAIRLFALAIASWLYRIEYTAWRVLAGGVGHTATFDGPFDLVMLYFFFVPNLALAEIVVRAKRSDAGAALLAATALLQLTATLALAVLTYFLTMRAWGPAIAAAWTGA